LSNIFIPPVFLVATCALKLENRRRAIHQLRLLNLAEGLWNTELAAKIAEAMLDIVDQFSIPAQEVEMRHMDFSIGQDGSTLHMRWEPDSEQFQNVAFSREIDLGAMPQADLVRKAPVAILRMELTITSRIYPKSSNTLATDLRGHEAFRS